jgi:NADH:ubiquinone oxidoreductase subunit 6 (subunit J)
MTAVVALFSVITVLAAALAVVFSDMRKVVVAAWVAGMGAGALFLSYGAEYLAIVQWIIATLGAISFLVYASLLGGYGVLDDRPRREKVFDAMPAALIGGCFFAIVTVAVLGKSTPLDGPAPELVDIGKSLVEKHVVSLELIGLLLLAALIGVGVIARPEETERGGSP